MTAVDSLVDVENLTVSFGRVRALDDVSLQIVPGHIVGLLGANGSGKSTLLRTLVGLYVPTHGICRTLGRPAVDLGPAELARIGYVHQEGELLDWMTTEQLIRYVSTYYPTWNRSLEDRYVHDFQLDLATRVGKLSPGQRQRLAILLAICFEPELLILDEPAAALDPIARRQFLDLLIQLIQDTNRTIVISSHILSDIEKIIDHVLILDQGKLIRDCPYDQFQEEFLAARLTSLGDRLPERLDFPGLIQCTRNTSQANLVFHHPARDHIETQAAALNCQIEFRPLPLEDLYKYTVTRKGGM